VQHEGNSTSVTQGTIADAYSDLKLITGLVNAAFTNLKLIAKNLPTAAKASANKTHGPPFLQKIQNDRGSNPKAIKNNNIKFL
jgi:hypothetical protein